MSRHQRNGHGGRNGSHPGQAAGSDRKQAAKRAKQAADQREADSRGITLAQLHLERTATVMHFQKGPPTRVTVNPPTPDRNATTRRGGYVM